jgi:hypothetical protein
MRVSSSPAGAGHDAVPVHAYPTLLGQAAGRRAQARAALRGGSLVVVGYVDVED